MIIWLSSYPKNGNTWLRSLISAYYYTNDGLFLGDKQLQNINNDERIRDGGRKKTKKKKYKKKYNS